MERGLAISRNLAQFGLSEADLNLVKAGITDGVLNRAHKVDLDTFGPKIQELAWSRQSALAAAEKKASEEFLAYAAAEKGAVKTASGLIYNELKPGAGESLPTGFGFTPYSCMTGSRLPPVGPDCRS